MARTPRARAAPGVQRSASGGALRLEVQQRTELCAICGSCAARIHVNVASRKCAHAHASKLGRADTHGARVRAWQV
jgi:hypothetical protein